MTRVRTIPESFADIAMDTIDYFGVEMAYNADGTANPSEIKFVYHIQNREADGTPIGRKTVYTEPFDAWPTVLKTDLKAVYQKLVSYAETEGQIGAGTDTDPLP